MISPMQLQPKVVIQITLDDMGQIQFVATSKNLITILGLMEVAKEGFRKQLGGQESKIEVARSI